jgi:hypothetical protein
MNLGGMPGDGESQISHGKWKETEIRESDFAGEIRRIRLCWDEFLINPAPRKTGLRILTTGAAVSDQTLKALLARSDSSAAPT